ncbi:uncharacterized protein LAESUDRAFT_729392 [Laetiporus sulphureus 93-53]|uniref:Uncharacterized protein n=1 Tax=Laetiporus sulphureus 93-53 TaxID=1314785 RepID=A0A165CP21_9APHY|nr:uncharacterized protein LAESUDRAFT_729392 [Laetiporus sulphureus 93-53]KZT03158.1 hypothetical protein LAESUDRAFT_729392 [Laetiporus sulphureus 93-53]
MLALSCSGRYNRLLSSSLARLLSASDADCDAHCNRLTAAYDASLASTHPGARRYSTVCASRLVYISHEYRVTRVILSGEGTTEEVPSRLAYSLVNTNDGGCY